MAELGNVLAIVLSVNALLFLGQVAALEMNPETPVFFHCNGTILSNFEAGGCQATGDYALADENITYILPSDAGEISVDSGNGFTDSYASATNWFTRTPGLGYLYNILAAPSNFLKALGLPSAFSWAIAALWYGFTILCFVAFIFGRDY